MDRFVTFALVILSVAGFLHVNAMKYAERRLMTDLLGSYDKLVRPVQNHTDTLKVAVSMSLLGVDELDAQRQTMTIHGWLEMAWSDETLRWDPGMYDHLSKVRIPANMLWLPDLVFMNDRSRPATTTSVGSRSNENAMVTYDGAVFHARPFELTFDCRVVMETFPTDLHACRTKLISWTHDGFQLDLTDRTATGSVQLDNYVGRHWKLLQTSVTRNVVYYPCCPEPFPDLVFEFTVQRDSLYFQVVYGSPSILLTLLVPLLFLMPFRHGQKIVFASCLLLATLLVFFMFAVTVPIASSAVPILVYNYLAILVLVSVSLILNTLIGNIYSEDSNRRLPKPLRTIVFALCGAFCCRREDDFKVKKSNVNDEESSEKHLLDDNHVSSKLEWKLLATILDRFLFLIFVVAVSIQITMFVVVFDPGFSNDGIV